MKTLEQEQREAIRTGDFASLMCGTIGKIDEIVRWINEYEREKELKELRLFERIVKMIDERVKVADPTPEKKL